MWSFGILTWEVFSLGATPYPGMTDKQVSQEVSYMNTIIQHMHALKYELVVISLSGQHPWDDTSELAPSTKTIETSVQL